MSKSFIIAVVVFTVLGYGVIHLAFSLAERAQDTAISQRR